MHAPIRMYWQLRVATKSQLFLVPNPNTRMFQPSTLPLIFKHFLCRFGRVVHRLRSAQLMSSLTSMRSTRTCLLPSNFAVLWGSKCRSYLAAEAQQFTFAVTCSARRKVGTSSEFMQAFSKWIIAIVRGLVADAVLPCCSSATVKCHQLQCAVVSGGWSRSSSTRQLDPIEALRYE